MRSPSTDSPHSQAAVAELPPGPDLAPERQTAGWIMRPLAFPRELRARYGDIFTLRMVGEPPWVIVSDPEAVKSVFLAPPDVLRAGTGKPVLEPVLGANSVMLLDGDPHMAQRKLLLPPFHGDRMAGYEDTMRAAMDAELDRWPTGVDEPAAPRMRAVALEVIVRTVFGVGDDRRVAALSGALGDLHLPANPDAAANPAFLRARERVDTLLFDQIDRHRGAEATGRSGEDVLSLLLEARHEDGSSMSDVEIRDELMTLLVAGHETTATTLSWALERLARSPAALERATADAEEGGGAYLDAAIRETLRTRPAVTVAPRAVEQPFELAGWTIPPGTIVAPSVLLVHHRPDVYPDPDAFRPERFLDRAPGTYTWIPFGGGVRRCIGASFALFQMRAMLSTLLARVSVRVADAEPEAMRYRAVTLLPSRGARIAVESRTRSKVA